MKPKLGRLEMAGVLVRLVNEQGSRCYYCRRGFVFAPDHTRRPTIDHKTPRWAGGSKARENLAAACFECNQLKGPMDAATFINTRANRQAFSRERRRACVEAQAINDAHFAPNEMQGGWLLAP